MKAIIKKGDKIVIKKVNKKKEVIIKKKMK
jgi:hypothetical protein